MTLTAADRFDPRLTTLAADRYDLLAAIRSESPVAYVGGIGMWAVTGYDAVREVLGDPGRFPCGGYTVPPHLPAEALAVYPPTGPLWRYALIGLDGDLHRRLRQPMVAAFRGRAVRALAPVIAADAEQLLDQLFAGDSSGDSTDEATGAGPVDPTGDPTGAGPVDLYERFARPLPSRTAARFFGLPVTDAPRFSAWSLSFVTLQVPGLPTEAYVAAAAQFAEFDAYIRDLVTGDPDRPDDGIVATLVAGRRDGSHDLTEDELVGDLANVLFAGHETTVNTLANLAVRVLGDRDLWASLVAGTADVPALVEELLRLDTSVVGLFRSTGEATTLAGVDLPAGVPLWVAFGAANRDPAAFPDPDTLDPSRPRHPAPLTFGHGLHVCIGTALARLQLELALTLLPRRFPTLELAAPTAEIPNHLLRITTPVLVRTSA